MHPEALQKAAGGSDANKWLICQHTNVSSPTRLTYINYIAFTRCMRAWPNTGMPLSIKRFNLQRMALQPPEKSRGGWGLGFAMKNYAVGGREKKQNTHKQFETSGLAKVITNYRPLGSTWGLKTSAAIGPLHAAFSSSQKWMNVCRTGVTCTSFLGSLNLEIKVFIFFHVCLLHLY